MEKKFKEPRIYMCMAVILSGLLPWLEIVVKVGASGADANSNTAISGIQTMQHSFLGILIFLVPIALIVMEFLPQIKMKLSAFYIAGSIFGIIISVVTIIACKSTALSSQGSDAGAAGVKVDTEVNLNIGFWLTIAIFIAVIIFTLIKDYAIDKNTLKEKGLKGVISGIASDVTKELSENVGSISSVSGVGNALSNAMTVPCPKCGTNVVKGKKFCSKCGEKMPEIIEKPEFLKFENKVRNQNKMMTVNEYIQSKILTQEKCESCNGEIVPGKKFCPDCGKSIIAKELKTNCTKCSSDLIFGKKFCVDCGTKVEGV